LQGIFNQPNPTTINLIHRVPHTKNLVI